MVVEQIERVAATPAFALRSDTSASAGVAMRVLYYPTSRTAEIQQV
jgi:hypothetical protein